MRSNKRRLLNENSTFGKRTVDVVVLVVLIIVVVGSF